MALSRKVIAEQLTYNPHDCTSSGWLARLWADGHVSLQYRTRWQGVRTGQRYVTDAGYVTLIDDDESAARDVLESVVEATWHQSPDESPSFRLTAPGFIVRQQWNVWR